MRLWPSAATLFPYTTLFRSRGEKQNSHQPGARVSRNLADPSRPPAMLTRLTCSCGDRKSTRLNSSHLVISYAVFCLKKKQTKHAVPAQPKNSHWTSS